MPPEFLRDTPISDVDKRHVRETDLLGHRRTEQEQRRQRPRDVAISQQPTESHIDRD